MTDLVALFTGTEGYTNVGKVAIVGEVWGPEERKVGAPFVGDSGRELTRMLTDAGLSRSDCFLTNVCSRQPPGQDTSMFFLSSKTAKVEGEQSLRGLYPDPQTRLDLARLHKQLAYIRPKVIVALGNYALWALTEANFKISNKKGWKVPTGITNWRGSYLEWNTWDADGIDPELHTPVIPTFHPAAIMRSWPDRTPAVHDLRARVGPLSKGFAVPKPEYRFTLKPSFEQVMDALTHLANLPAGSWITSDTETRGESVACLGIAWSDKDAICIPFASAAANSGSYWSPEEEARIVTALEAPLSGNRLRLSNQNINFDRQYWRRFLFVQSRPSFDTMVAQHVCWPGTPRGLAYIASLYCRYYKFWKDDGRKWDIDQDESVLWRYCCVDCVTTWESTQVLQALISKLGLNAQFAERMRFLEVAFRLMLRGIRVDDKERARQIMQVMEDQSKIENYFGRIIPSGWLPLLKGKTSSAEWYNSPAQAAALFYDILGCKEIIDRKTGNRTLDDDALLRIGQSHPLLAQLVEPLQSLRSLGVILSNQLMARADQDGRMRSTFDITGTDTFRWSSYENAFWRGMNLQNISTEKDE